MESRESHRKTTIIIVHTAILHTDSEQYQKCDSLSSEWQQKHCTCLLGMKLSVYGEQIQSQLMQKLRAKSQCLHLILISVKPLQAVAAWLLFTHSHAERPNFSSICQKPHCALYTYHSISKSKMSQFKSGSKAYLK